MNTTFRYFDNTTVNQSSDRNTFLYSYSAIMSQEKQSHIMAEARQCQTVRLKIIYLEVLRSPEDLFRCMTISEFLIEGAIGLTLKAVRRYCHKMSRFTDTKQHSV